MSSPNLIAQAGDSLREAFGRAVTALGRTDSRVLVLDGDVAGGTGTHHFRAALSEQFVQCGIAEQNMIGVAAGLARSGFVPFVSTFATFLLRGYEQARLSIAYSGANVKLVGSHTGLDVGPDGGSAQCLEDISAFRVLPGFVVLCPATPYEMEMVTEAALNTEGPVYIRSGRSPISKANFEIESFSIGKSTEIRHGDDLTLVACGSATSEAVGAADILEGQGLQARVVNMSSVKPIDRDAILRAARETRFMVTVEDHSVYGGLGSAVAEVITENEPCALFRFGLDDTFGESGDPRDLYAKYRIDAESIASRIADIYDAQP